MLAANGSLGIYMRCRQQMRTSTVIGNVRCYYFEFVSIICRCYQLNCATANYPPTIIAQCIQGSLREITSVCVLFANTCSMKGTVCIVHKSLMVWAMIGTGPFTRISPPSEYRHQWARQTAGPLVFSLAHPNVP